MKRFLSLLVACLMLCSISFAENNYDKDFDNVFNSIFEHVQKSQYVVTANLMMWQEVGPQQFASMLADIMRSETYDDMIYDGKMRVVFGTIDARSVFKTYKQNYLDSVYLRSSQNSQPNSDAPNMDSRKKRGRVFRIARSDPPPAF